MSARNLLPAQIAGEIFSYPRSFTDETDYDYDGGGFQTIPNFELERENYDIRTY